MGKENLLDKNLDEICQMLAGWGEPTFRGRQVWERLYRGYAASFGEMSELPKGLRERLESQAAIRTLSPLLEQKSSDGQTRKMLFALPDGAQIESVLMGYERRLTACISSQAGCAMACSFCATGQAGFQRNLTSGEIVEQVLFFVRELASDPAGNPQPSYKSDEAAHGALTNIVLMGMGEPMANYAHVMEAIYRLNDPGGFNFGARRMTISTVGLVPGIEKLAREPIQVNLAVSLHAATDELRDRLAPMNRRYPLNVLLPAVQAYIERTHRRVSLEWALIEGVNDTPEQARALARLVKGMLCHVNMIPLNPTQGYAGGASTRERIEVFRNVLEASGIPNTLRIRRGIDIQAGCGQLRQHARQGQAGPAARGGSWRNN